uniref:LIM domain only 4b n=1 Tax=Amphilophus citrinellus TaxID=61819 RepID=A0A3Q0RCF7_AMPCI
MVNPGGSNQPPPVGTGSLSWKRCAGCGGKIADRFLLYTMDTYWHSRCLKCSCCQAQLGEIGTSCYTKSGMILCRNDYIRLFGNSGACSACGQSIPASELVMRAQGNVYHLKCFTCSTCRNRLVPGDRFHYINGSLFCEHDRPTALINGHLSSLQTNPLLPDQKVRPPRRRTEPAVLCGLVSEYRTSGRSHQSAGVISRKRKTSVIFTATFFTLFISMSSIRLHCEACSRY